VARRSFRILSINVSVRKGMQKTPVGQAQLRAGHGIVGDAHAGPWHRQLSLLADEDVQSMRGRGVQIHCGDFAENLTTWGVDLAELPVGTRLHLGQAVVEVTQIGKECHGHCAIYRAVGDCVMPRRGIFARVLEGGEISPASECFYEEL
jgi:MOSC domain-containing protein YiiM